MKTKLILMASIVMIRRRMEGNNEDADKIMLSICNVVSLRSSESDSDFSPDVGESRVDAVAFARDT